MANEPLPAVCLISGGMDSTVVGAIARERGFRVFALTVAYGQRHAVELQSAARVAQWLGAAEHLVLHVDLRAFGGSALTDDIAVPRSNTQESDGGGIPITYVPARNTILLALAMAHAEVIGARHVFIGVNAVDYSGYPDCRPEFIDAFNALARVATQAGVEGRGCSVEAPLLRMSKCDIIREGSRLGVDFGLTHSCYDPAEDGSSCGECESCVLRMRGFREAGVPDPTRYVRAHQPARKSQN